MARELGVTACAVIGLDLAALETNFLAPVLTPILENRCELAMPFYTLGKFDGLLNSSILYPLTRALYGRRVRFPLAPDFCFRPNDSGTGDSPATIGITGADSFLAGDGGGAARSLRLSGLCGHSPRAGSRRGGPEHHSYADGRVHCFWILPPMLRCGSAFAVPSMETFRRGSRRPPTGHAHADTTPMIETFQLGFRNLQEVWSLVLPPVTLLELKRLSRMRCRPLPFAG